MRLSSAQRIFIRMRHLLAILAVVPLAFTLPAACGSAEVLPCGQIPADGCPVGRGGTCEDPFCAALYDCVEGAWRLTDACPGGTGGGGGGISDAGSSSDACDLVVIDHAGETTGCKPDLQNPDCPAVAAESCAASACLTDCIDFYLCKTEGWSLVAYCNEEGQVVLTP